MRRRRYVVWRERIYTDGFERVKDYRTEFFAAWRANRMRGEYPNSKVFYTKEYE